MADLRVENPRLSERFLHLLAAEDVILPLAASETEIGSVVDAAGAEVFVVDANHERDDDAQVFRIASWIALAVNTCGGFKLERST